MLTTALVALGLQRQWQRKRGRAKVITGKRGGQRTIRGLRITAVLVLVPQPAIGQSPSSLPAIERRLNGRGRSVGLDP